MSKTLPDTPTVIALPDFRKAIDMLTSVVERRNTIPILSNVAMSYRSGTLTLDATDLDIQLSTTLDVQGGDRLWQTTVSAHTFAALLKTMSGETVALNVTDDKKLSVVGEGVEATLATINYDDFPKGTTFPDAPALRFNAAKLAGDIAFVASAISREETRYYLNGFCLATYDACPVIVATDGHRLHVADIEAMDGLPTGNPIVPRRTSELIGRLIGGNPHDDIITLWFAGNRLAGTIAHWRFKSKLIDGTYPDFTRVIPKDNERRLTVGARELHAAVNSAAAISGERTRAVKFAADPAGRLIVSCQSPENGNAKAVAKGSAMDSGAGCEVGFNHKYLGVITRAFGKAGLVMAFQDASAPTLWTSPEVPGRRCVLMPMRV